MRPGEALREDPGGFPIGRTEDAHHQRSLEDRHVDERAGPHQKRRRNG